MIANTLFRKNNCDEKNSIRIPQQISLEAYPYLTKACFDLLQNAGAKYFCLFGGAVRDADYAAYHQTPCKIKDYDIRIWFDEFNYEEERKWFIKKLTTLANSQVREISNQTTNKNHYSIIYKNIELDISIRACQLGQKLRPETVAIDRVKDSDIALSAVAIDPLEQAWAMRDYMQDRNNKTLTVYFKQDSKYQQAYVERMKKKFPNHTINWNVECKVDKETRASCGLRLHRF